MKRSLKLIAALIAASTAMTCTAAAASAEKLKTTDGVTYRYSDSGERIGTYTGWQTGKGGARYYCKNGVKLRNKWLKVGGRRTYYFLKNGKMATGEVTVGGKTYIFGQDGRLEAGGWDIRAKAVSVTGTALDLQITLTGENKENELRISDDYRIEKKTAEGWVMYDEEAWGEAVYDGYTVLSGSDEIKLPIRYYCGELAPGSYRIVKEVTETGGEKELLTRTVYAGFKITADTPERWGLTLSADKVTRKGLTFTLSQTEGYPAAGTLYAQIRYNIGKTDASGKVSWEEYPDPAVVVKNGFVHYYPAKAAEILNDDGTAITPEAPYTRTIDSFYCGELVPGNYKLKVFVNCRDSSGNLTETCTYITDLEVE